MRHFKQVLLFTITLGFSNVKAQCDSLNANYVRSISFLTVQFQDLSTGDSLEWFWDFGDGTSDSVQNPIHVYSVPPTRYTVCLTVRDICLDSITFCNIIDFGSCPDPFPIGIQNSTVDQFKIFPNPVTSYFQIESIEEIEIDDIILYNLNGKAILKYKNILSNQNIPIHNIESGLYYLVLEIRGQSFTKRLLIK